MRAYRQAGEPSANGPAGAPQERHTSIAAEGRRGVDRYAVHPPHETPAAGRLADDDPRAAGCPGRERGDDRPRDRGGREARRHQRPARERRRPVHQPHHRRPADPVAPHQIPPAVAIEVAAGHDLPAGIPTERRRGALREAVHEPQDRRAGHPVPPEEIGPAVTISVIPARGRDEPPHRIAADRGTGHDAAGVHQPDHRRAARAVAPDEVIAAVAIEIV